MSNRMAVAQMKRKAIRAAVLPLAAQAMAAHSKLQLPLAMKMARRPQAEGKRANRRLARRAAEKRPAQTRQTQARLRVEMALRPSREV